MQSPALSLAARSSDLEDLIEKARSYIHAAKSPATLRAYRTDFEDFMFERGQLAGATVPPGQAIAHGPSVQ
jgi:hypothetical protein